ncbi:hypothetical protein BJX64DRAFT_253856 [Aspergillus heterothallicus]
MVADNFSSMPGDVEFITACLIHDVVRNLVEAGRLHIHHIRHLRNYSLDPMHNHGLHPQHVAVRNALFLQLGYNDAGHEPLVSPIELISFGRDISKVLVQLFLVPDKPGAVEEPPPQRPGMHCFRPRHDPRHYFSNGLSSLLQPRVDFSAEGIGVWSQRLVTPEQIEKELEGVYFLVEPFVQLPLFALRPAESVEVEHECDEECVCKGQDSHNAPGH